MDPGRAYESRRAVLRSAFVHGAALLAVVVAHFIQPRLPEVMTVQLEWVSPPTPVPEEPTRTEELVIRTPDPEPVVPEPEPDPEPPPPDEDEEPEPEPVEEEDEEEEPPPDPPEDAQPDPTVEPEPVEDAEVAEENTADVSAAMEGLIRDFPEYYRNIIDWMNRCNRWRGAGRLEATVYFVIHRDGSVSGIRVMERSGNRMFDLRLIESVECASDRFGPLPEEMVRDRLPIAFTRTPSRAPASE